MSIEDYPIQTLATVDGKGYVVVHPDGRGGWVYVDNDGDATPWRHNLTDLRRAIVLPLPEVNPGTISAHMYGYLLADGYKWSANHSDSYLEALVAQGAAAAAVLLHRRAEREVVAHDLTADLNAVMACVREFAGASNAEAAKRIRHALSDGARLVEGEES
jgi:hypothetical protein